MLGQKQVWPCDGVCKVCAAHAYPCAMFLTLSIVYVTFERRGVSCKQYMFSMMLPPRSIFCLCDICFITNTVPCLSAYRREAGLPGVSGPQLTAVCSSYLCCCQRKPPGLAVNQHCFAQPGHGVLEMVSHPKNCCTFWMQPVALRSVQERCMSTLTIANFLLP